MEILKIFTVFLILSNKKAKNSLSFYCTAKAENWNLHNIKFSQMYNIK